MSGIPAGGEVVPPFNNGAIDMVLMQVIQNLRRELYRHNLVELSREIGIDYHVLYNFRRGAVNNPRIDTLAKMIKHLMPQVQITGVTRDEEEMKPAAE